MAGISPAQAVHGHVVTLTVLAGLLVGGAALLLILGIAQILSDPSGAGLIPWVLVLCAIPAVPGAIILGAANRLAKGPRAFGRGELLDANGAIAGGATMLALCGGCSSLIWIPGFFQMMQGTPDEYGFFAMSLYIGGIPTAIGLALLVQDLARRKLGQALPPAPPQADFRGDEEGPP
jgi:hypothetical protein